MAINVDKLNKRVLIPIGVSARHCHLSITDVEQLFGEGYRLTKNFMLSQPGQFACNETITIKSEKGEFNNVRVLGPERSVSQVEISKTDAIRLGLNPPVRESGDIKGSAPIEIIGPKGSVKLDEGLIIAKAHIHMTPSDSKRLNLENGQFVSVLYNNEKRSVQFNNVIIRISQKFSFEMHIDTDEANAGLISTGDKGILIVDD